jgi:D-amino peptidase
MVQGIDQGVDAAIFIGYHARSGQSNAVLSHTWDKTTIANLWMNGLLVGEIGLNAALCGHFGVPLILIAGDQAACSEAKELLDPIETVAVKIAHGRYSAECLPLAVSQAGIQTAAHRAIETFRAGLGPEPFKIQAPVELVVELKSPEMADQASLIPGSTRLENQKIYVSAPDMPAAYQAFRAIALLAAA